MKGTEYKKGDRVVLDRSNFRNKLEGTIVDLYFNIINKFFRYIFPFFIIVNQFI